LRTEEGKEAKAWLEDALMPLEAIYVQTIKLKTKAKRDKYGRFLAVLYSELPTLVPVAREPIHPSSINARMVVEGHAKERYW
jgi:endonuclease YncB( thermonuclease family)